MDGQWEIAQGQSLRPSRALESPVGQRGGSTGLSVGELLLRALHKPLGHFLFFFSPKVDCFRTLMQFLAKHSLPKAGASQGKHELKIVICTM